MPKPNPLGDDMFYIHTKKIKRKDKIYDAWRISIPVWDAKLKKRYKVHDSTYSKKKYTLEKVMEIRDKIMEDKNIKRNTII